LFWFCLIVNLYFFLAGISKQSAPVFLVIKFYTEQMLVLVGMNILRVS